jgi:hypothetical protein
VFPSPPSTYRGINAIVESAAPLNNAVRRDILVFDFLLVLDSMMTFSTFWL